jgi:hypothetical protein
MNVNGFTREPGRSGMVWLFLLVLLGNGMFGLQPLHAATTKKFVLTPSEAHVFQVWTNYLAQSPQTWSTTHAPAFTPAIKSTIWQVIKTDTQAQALANPMIDYLLWRRSLNPTRFSSNHPNLSPALAQLLTSPTIPPTVPPPTYTPVPQTATAPQVVSAPLTSAAQTVAPPAVPEPSSLLLAAAMTGWGIWWRRRIAQRTSR